MSATKSYLHKLYLSLHISDVASKQIQTVVKADHLHLTSARKTENWSRGLRICTCHTYKILSMFGFKNVNSK